MKTRILILCTGNSCRSQMAEAFLKSFDRNIKVFSAGTKPADKVNPKAIQVMKEIGIDLANNKTKNVSKFLNQSFDFVITVCNNAKQVCPRFRGEVKSKMHLGFYDPAEYSGTDTWITSEYRRLRDEIRESFYDLYVKKIKFKESE